MYKLLVYSHIDHKVCVENHIILLCLWCGDPSQEGSNTGEGYFRIPTLHEMASSSSAKADYREEKAFEDICSFGSFSKKDTFTVYKDCDRFVTKEWEDVRRSLEHLNIVKFHYSYSELSCLRRKVASGDLSQDRSCLIRSFVLESLDFAGGTVATVAQQRADNLREFNIWRRLASLSSALTYLHSHKRDLYLSTISLQTQWSKSIQQRREGRHGRVCGRCCFSDLVQRVRLLGVRWFLANV